MIKMKFSIVQSFFKKFNFHNRISNGKIEKNLIDFFHNFIVESDYEPFVVFGQFFHNKDVVVIDWCTSTDHFFINVYEDQVVLLKNEIRITIGIEPNIMTDVHDYIKCWMES